MFLDEGYGRSYDFFSVFLWIVFLGWTSAFFIWIAPFVENIFRTRSISIDIIYCPVYNCNIEQVLLYC